MPRRCARSSRLRSEDLRRPLVQEGEIRMRRPAMERLRPLARLARGDHARPWPPSVALDRLARLTADIDRTVLTGVVEGLGWIGIGAGWAAAWLDRRGLDAVDHGLTGLGGVTGRACARAVGHRPGRSLAWAVAAVLILTLVGRSLN